MAITNTTQFVSVPLAELNALLEMARDVSKRSPYGAAELQPWNPDLKVVPDLGDGIPTVSGIVGETNMVLISIPDMELIRRLFPSVGANNNWWINGEDTGVSAIPDATKIMRPQFLIRPPLVLTGELADTISVSGGAVTVDDGISSVVEIPIATTTLNIAGKKMAAVDSAGAIHLYDTKLPVAGHVPILYFLHTDGELVDVAASVEIAMSAAELSYYVTALRLLDSDYLDQVKVYITSALAQLETILATADARLTGVPRAIAFCHINDFEYITPNEIGYFVADHNFEFKDNFAGSVARCKLKPAYSVLASSAVIAIWLESHVTKTKARIGSIQFNPGEEASGVFIQYSATTQVMKNDTISFIVDGMDGVASVSVTLNHLLV